MLRITVLCDNIAGPKSDLLGEHGLSLLIERGEKSYLFDTGQGHTLFHNAIGLGKDLRKVEKIFISHGHYDHTGGLEKVLSLKGGKDIFIHPHAFVPRYANNKKEGNKLRNIGMKYSQTQLDEMGTRIHCIDCFNEIEEGIYLTGEIPRIHAFERGDKNLTCNINGKFQQDMCRDDQSLVIDTPKGLLILLGCTHAGIINTLTHIRANLTTKKIFAIIGGTHLESCNETQLRETIHYLQNFSFQRFGLSHCSGLKVFNRLWQIYHKKVFVSHAGTVLEI